MKILAIDTSSRCCSVMLTIGTGSFLCTEATAVARTRHLLSYIDDLLTQNLIDPQSLDLLAWNAGPGSFTGLRIGASVIQALAYSFNLPVQPLSSLEVLAYAALRRRDSQLNGSTMVAVAQDARMGGVYWAVFKIQRDSLERLEPDQLLLADRQSLAEMIGDDWLLVGDAWQLPKLQMMSQQYIQVDVSAADVMSLALYKGKSGWIHNPAECLPYYIRDSVHWQKRQRRSELY